jgi:hypothetical protein
MTKRLQVLLEDAELREYQRAARSQRLTTAAWVRRALRAAVRSEAEPSVADKMAVVRRAVEHDFPTGDIDQLLSEIERGYSGSDA